MKEKLHRQLQGIKKKKKNTRKTIKMTLIMKQKMNNP